MTSGSDITRADGPVLLGKFGDLGVALGDVLCGKYRVDGELGRGGMGVILAATHLDLGEKVALKILAGHDMNERSLLRLRREAQIAARLRSEHVVRVMDINEVRPGMPMMVMERLEGEDVASILRQR
ncbi:MAG TPA: protein kinase, partial [Polyangium sp.]|nr:protein kinase [Polyangium sp.]